MLDDSNNKANYNFLSMVIQNDGGDISCIRSIIVLNWAAAMNEKQC